MKIKTVNYMNGEARFVLENDPSISHEIKDGKPQVNQGTKTYCIDLKQFKTKEEVLTELRSRLPANTTEALYNSLELKKLEGTDI